MDPIDLTVLGGAAGGNRHALHELLRDYVRINRPVMAQLEAACTAGDAAESQRLAHRLAGSSHMVGARPLGDRLAELERTVKAGDSAAASRTLAVVLAQFAAVCAWIEALPRD